ncbi:MAG: polyprenyl synthetase family protein [Delftia acidovorans]|nr:polyprenyl synthetase family protein [Delftia acidovorans]
MSAVMTCASDVSQPAGPGALDFPCWMTDRLARTESALSQWVGVDAPAGLGEAMRYAVLDGGKRLRPLLVWAAAEAVDGLQPAAVRAGCAVELIHAYSLVHDDMHCMDNDVLRRGKPTVHVQFGEAPALLAGDALQALAFEMLVPEPDQAGSMPDALQARLCRLLGRAAGAQGMAGGQAIDLASVGLQLSEAQLREMHRLKTGALLHASVPMGAACKEGVDAHDILDVVADSATLGKTAGKDAANDKPTYVSLLGLDQARAHADELCALAHAALARSGLPDTRALAALADMVVSRTH